ncbi:DNA-methyltransferase [Robertmurraya siralis]|uniref:DNA-methyltransferase n=1 Tax=Robertmurraya siralis TaxID=77777 RepID=UPI002E268236
MIELNKIYNEDCLEGMKRIEGKSIDMILCDLPYQVSSQSWDIQIPLKELWEQYERIIKNNGVIVLTATNPFASILVNSNLKMFKYEWIWDKEQGTNQFLKDKQPLRKHEQVLVFYKNQPTYNPIMIQSWRREIKIRAEGKDPITGVESKEKTNYDSKGLKYPTTILPINRPHWREGRFHPTQKPIALFKYLIETYTNENDIVLDNCMGSGTTAVACINTHRNFIGFELDKEYHRLAEDRIHSLV